MVADRGPATSAVTLIFCVLCTVFVAARFYTRIWLVRSVKQDDYWILAAWLCAVGFSASICVGVHYGLGRHSADISTVHSEALRKAEYAFDIFYNPSLMLTKTSIIVFFLSVMSKDVDPIFKWSNWLTLAVVNVAGLALTLLNIFQCRPVAAAHQYPTPANAQCIDIVTLYLSSAPVNIITDLAILFLPMPILTGMRLPRKQKIILIVTFSFGAFVTAVDVVRIAYLQNAALNRFTVVKTQSSGNPRTIEQQDFPWYASLSFMWSAVEVNLGIICACVPCLKPLFSRFFPSFIRDAGEELSPHGSIDEGNLKLPGVRAEGSAPNGSMVTNPAAFRKPAVKEYSGDDSGDEMGFLNMLAGPDDDAPHSKIHRTSTKLTRTGTGGSTASASASASDFDFVTMSSTRNVLKLSNRESIWPIAVVTVIFFLWGFAYGLLDTLNAQFQKVVNISTEESLGLHAAYFGGYLVGPLTLGQFMLKKYGFKAAMMAGLCVYGCGTLVFWPSAVLTSYTAFVISNFIVAFGLSCLEIAANPYIAICGPLEYAEARLNFSQGFQAIGSVLSPLLAQKVLFRSVSKDDAPSLVNVQWTYLGIALFVIALAVVFYYIPLPEATDEQLAAMADRREAVYSAKLGPYRVVWITLALGVFSQWCYVGGQEAIGGNVENLVEKLLPRSTQNPFDYSITFHTVFAVGRFIAAFLNYIMKPRWILLFLYLGLIITCGLQMGLNGPAGVGISQLTAFFEAGTFSIIYAICMRGMGADTKTAAALMTAAISGGAVPPFIQWAVSKTHGIKYSYCVPLAVFAFGMIFPIYLNLLPAARLCVDPTHENRNMRRAARKGRGRTESELTDVGDESRQFGLMGIIARRRRLKLKEAEGPSTLHIERRRQGSGSVSVSSSTQIEEKTADFLTTPSPVAVKQGKRKGEVGELAPWPGDDKNNGEKGSSSRAQSSNDEDAIEQDFTHLHDEKFIDDDGTFDEYHRIMKAVA
jgi:fucose permease